MSVAGLAIVSGFIALDARGRVLRLQAEFNKNKKNKKNKKTNE